jgi:hypothetical protein
MKTIADYHQRTRRALGSQARKPLFFGISSPPPDSSDTEQSPQHHLSTPIISILYHRVQTSRDIYRHNFPMSFRRLAKRMKTTHSFWNQTLFRASTR